MVMTISPDCYDVPIEGALRAAPLQRVPFDPDLAICSAPEKPIHAAKARIPGFDRDARNSIRAKSLSRLNLRDSCF